MRIFSSLALLAAALSLSQCSLPKDIQYQMGGQELLVGTNSAGDWRYHRVAEEPFGLGLRFPGYLIAFEKADRRDRLDLLYFKTKPRSWYLEPAGIEGVASWLDDSRQAFLSHVVRYSYRQDLGAGALWPDELYNVYRDARKIGCKLGEPCKKLYCTGVELFNGNLDLPIKPRLPVRVLIFADIIPVFIDMADCPPSLLSGMSDAWGLLAASEAKGKELAPGHGNLRRWLEHDLDRLDATHLILYSMGWNTDQQEALRNYNSLVSHLLHVAEARGATFRPLVIAVSWDSLAGTAWTRPFTYPISADDADEIGAVWINRLLRKVLVPIREARPDLRLVLVGHSFGARVVTRALFSYPLLDIETVDPQQVDLVIGLQSAFSINRFIEGKGNEGWPYEGYDEVAGKIALTWSDKDTANPKARWLTGAKHAGGQPGYRQAEKHPEIFELATWCCKCAEAAGCQPWSPRACCEGGWTTSLESATERVLMIDASDIVDHRTHQKGGYAHSDIYSHQMAELIWQLIEDFAPTCPGGCPAVAAAPPPPPGSPASRCAAGG